MNNAELRERPQFYFALPRLVASQLGWNADRTEDNWIEANIVGGVVHLIWYVFAAHLFLNGLPMWERIALLLPLALLVWVSWLIAIYINSVLIRLLRAGGLFRDLPDVRVQSVLLGVITTAFAFYLVESESGLALLGIAWVAAVSLNLLAAAVFVVSDAVNPVSE